VDENLRQFSKVDAETFAKLFTDMEANQGRMKVAFQRLKMFRGDVA
jgi:hypothetical protein